MIKAKIISIINPSGPIYRWFKYLNIPKSTRSLMKVLLLGLFQIFLFVSFVSGQTCPPPANPTTGIITSSTAEINWNSVPGADGYELEYRAMNAPSNVPWNNVSIGTNTTTLTGLTANTVYSAQIRTVCGSNFSNYTGKISFSGSVPL